MTDQTIVAVFDTPAHAELAVQDLLQAGIPEWAVHRHAQEGSYVGAAAAPVTRETEGHGFWASLFGGEPDHDTTVYDRSMQGGSTTVTVQVSDEHAAKAMIILETHNPIDMDERADSYGLSPTSNLTPPGKQTAAAATIRSDNAQAGIRSDTAQAGTRSDTAQAVGRSNAEEGVIQLSEEVLAVGKRLVNRGTTRIRRFVVETPVEEQVRLRDEKVVVERRPVTGERAATNADFSDKVIEMTETAEEAVISKTARVKEEVSLRKEAAERTETVRDSVRHEDVEIVKVPGNTNVEGGSSSTQSDTAYADTATRKTGY